jgi:hypothetical protein
MVVWENVELPRASRRRSDRPTSLSAAGTDGAAYVLSTGRTQDTQQLCTLRPGRVQRDACSFGRGPRMKNGLSRGEAVAYSAKVGTTSWTIAEPACSSPSSTRACRRGARTVPWLLCHTAHKSQSTSGAAVGHSFRRHRRLHRTSYRRRIRRPGSHVAQRDRRGNVSDPGSRGQRGTLGPPH